MKTFLAPLATIALVGLAACSGNQGSDNAADTATIESNLTSVDEDGANDTAFGNDATWSNDSAPLTGGDPVLNATGNATDL